MSLAKLPKIAVPMFARVQPRASTSYACSCRHLSSSARSSAPKRRAKYFEMPRQVNIATGEIDDPVRAQEEERGVIIGRLKSEAMLETHKYQQLTAESPKRSPTEKYGSVNGFGLKNTTRYQVEEGVLTPVEGAGVEWRSALGVDGARHSPKFLPLPGSYQDTRPPPNTLMLPAGPETDKGAPSPTEYIEEGLRAMQSKMIASPLMGDTTIKRAMGPPRIRAISPELTVVYGGRRSRAGKKIYAVERHADHFHPAAFRVDQIRKYSTASIRANTGGRPLPRPRNPTEPARRRREVPAFNRSDDARAGTAQGVDGEQTSEAAKPTTREWDLLGPAKIYSPYVPPLATKRPWEPIRKLTFDAMAGLKALHQSDPEKFNRAYLAKKFSISYEAVTRIIKSRYREKAANEVSTTEPRPAARLRGDHEENANRLTGTKWDKRPSGKLESIPAILRRE